MNGWWHEGIPFGYVKYIKVLHGNKSQTENDVGPRFKMKLSRHFWWPFSC